MVRHVVMFKFLPEADGRSKAENVTMTAERLRALSDLDKLYIDRLHAVIAQLELMEIE